MELSRPTLPRISLKQWSAALAGFSAMLLLAASGQAQDVWLSNGKDAPPDAALASSGHFGIQQIMTLDSDGLIERWNQPGAGVMIDSSSTVARNQPIFSYIIFTGCKADDAGKCNVTAIFKTFDPKGKPWGDQTEAPVWVGLPPPADRILQLSASGLGVVVEDKDRLGEYRVTADVTDHVAGIMLHVEKRFTAVAAKTSGK